MMYFCPCSCDDPIDPETEESTFFSLPRNLSYVQESYLDRYSVSSRFVHNPKIERSFQYEQNEEHKANVESEHDSLLSAVKDREFLFTRASENKSNNSTANSFLESYPIPVFAAVDSPSAATHIVYSSNLETTGDTVTTGPPVQQQQQQPLPPPPQTQQQETVTTPSTSPISLSQSASHFSSSSFLAPASRVASRLSALLHSPPNESMDSARNLGSSVDGDNLDITSVTSALERRDPNSPLRCPQSLGEDMDRGQDMEDHVRFRECCDMDCSGDVVNDCHHSNAGEGEGEQVEEQEGEVLSPEDPLLKPFGSGGKSHFPRADMDADGHQRENHKPRSETATSIPYGSPDSEGFSEEGVFVNMDDIDINNDNPATVSEVSDDTCVSSDSQFLSPEEGELDLEPPRKMSLQEAISRAAEDLSKMSLELYGSAQPGENMPVVKVDDDEQTEGQKFRRTLATMGRDSPVRGHTGLKIKINDSDADSTSTSTILSDSPVYPENEFNFSRMELRKSSSLKTNKTPPGTPHRKKVVRFADAMGLDLEAVRHVVNMESPPKIPASAMADLHAGLSEENKEVGSKYLAPCFSQPGALDNFVQKVLSQKVCLENAVITDLTITGFIRVCNMSFNKSVRIRYTHNKWATFHDIAASYVQNSCDGPTDRFSFSIVAPPYFVAGNQLEFAVSFNAGGVEYWDNNDGKNYVFECFAKTIPSDSETMWLHFL